MKQIIICTIAIIIAACNTKNQQQPSITVTIQPQAYFLEQIVGDKYKINTMIPSGSSPESYDPSPAQIVQLANSQALFIVGKLGFELAWKDKIQNNNPKLKIYDNSIGIQTNKTQQQCQHNHTNEHNNTHTHTHTEGDPHIWSSPKTALIMIKNMYEAIIQLDPNNQQYYTQNYQTLRQQVIDLHNKCEQKLAKVDNKAFLIYHPSLGHLANDYGLIQLPIEYEGKEPTPKHLAQISKIAKENNVKVIFIQPEFDKKNAQILAKALNIPTITINPLAYQWEDQINAIVDALCQ